MQGWAAQHHYAAGLQSGLHLWNFVQTYTCDISPDSTRPHSSMDAMCGLSETFRPWCNRRHALCGLAPAPTRLPWFVSSDIATYAVAVLARTPTLWKQRADSSIEAFKTWPIHSFNVLILP